MLKFKTWLVPIVAAAGVTAGLISPSAAQETIKIGVISQDSGPFAQNGQGFHRGVAAYQALHGDMIGGRKVKFIFRDVGGPKPAVAKRLVEELIARDKVQMVAGFALSSDALAAGKVIQETKTPAITFVASSPSVLASSQYFLKSGQNIAQSASSSALFARQRGKKRCYVIVSDYQPGYDAQKAFSKTFEEHGGKIVGHVRVPLSTVDFSAIVERVANANVDCINIFVPPGAPAIGLLRALSERGLVKKDFVIGMGEAEDHILPQYDDSVIGFYQSLYYAEALKNPQNKAFVAELKKLYGPKTLPDFASASAYDGTHLIYQMVKSQKGKKWNGPAAVEAVKGLSWNGVRGPIKIDPKTRELIQNIYLRKVEKIDGKLTNVVVDKLTGVKAPTKAWMDN